MNASYTKLKDGDWGVRIEGTLDKGTRTEITVTKRSGETKTEKVVVLWSGKGISLAKIITKSTRSSGSSGYSRSGRNYGRSYGGRRRERFQDDEGCSWPCHVCGRFCRSGENQYCVNNR